MEQRRAELENSGVDFADVGAEFGQECPDDSHDYEDLPFAYMWLSKTVSDRVGRWPTLRELRAAVEAGRQFTREFGSGKGGILLAFQNGDEEMRLADWPGLDKYLPRRSL